MKAKMCCPLCGKEVDVDKELTAKRMESRGGFVLKCSCGTTSQFKFSKEVE